MLLWCLDNNLLQQSCHSDLRIRCDGRAWTKALCRRGLPTRLYSRVLFSSVPRQFLPIRGCRSAVTANNWVHLATWRWAIDRLLWEAPAKSSNSTAEQKSKPEVWVGLGCFLLKCNEKKYPLYVQKAAADEKSCQTYNAMRARVSQTINSNFSLKAARKAISKLWLKTSSTILIHYT